ncbi:hypothetical protein PMAYCL1PPCAC_19415, partial [Pristionchus mayeri]
DTPTVKIGVELDKSDPNEWIVIIARNGADPCSFSIGNFKFVCGTAGDKSAHGNNVIFQRKQSGSGLDGLEFEKYSIRAQTPNEPVADAFKLYENPKTTLSLTDSKMDAKSLEIVLFQPNCEAGVPEVAPGPSAKPANKGNNKYTCDDPSSEIYLGSKKTSAKVTICSQNGWRDGTTADFIDYKQATVYCYSGAIPMFDKCAQTECHAIDLPLPATAKLAQITTKPTTPAGTVGIDLDKSDSNKWIVILARTGGEQCSFSIGGHE